MIALSALIVGQQAGAFPWWIVFLIAALIVGAIAFAFVINFGRLYILAWSNKAKVGVWELINMWLRGVNGSVIVQNKIRAWKTGLTEISTEDLATHFLARGRVPNVVQALISAHPSRDPAGLSHGLCDRPGRSRYRRRRPDQCESQSHRLPGPGQGAHDHRRGRQGWHSAQGEGARKPSGRTSRGWSAAPPKRRLSLALARASYRRSARRTRTRKCWRTRTRFPRAVLAKGLDAGTAFEIRSIDIADVDVGTNIGARLQADQAEADKKRFPGRS